MTDVKALIERLEQATEGSRELDGEIFRLVYPCQDPAHWHRFQDAWAHQDHEDAIAYEMANFYTTSLDAALTLVPEGDEWVVSNHGQIGLENLAFAGVYGAAIPGSSCDTNAASPALALCIAALKARSAQ